MGEFRANDELIKTRPPMLIKAKQTLLASF